MEITFGDRPWFFLKGGWRSVDNFLGHEIFFLTFRSCVIFLVGESLFRNFWELKRRTWIVENTFYFAWKFFFGSVCCVFIFFFFVFFFGNCITRPSLLQKTMVRPRFGCQKDQEGQDKKQLLIKKIWWRFQFLLRCCDIGLLVVLTRKWYWFVKVMLIKWLVSSPLWVLVRFWSGNHVSLLFEKRI